MPCTVIKDSEPEDFSEECIRCGEVVPAGDELVECPTCGERVCTAHCIAGRWVSCFQCEETA